MWTKLADSLSWGQGHQGKGYLLHDGTIKTWNVDPFNPVDHFTIHQQNGETSPSALNFEIDPDGGVVTDEPTTKVEAITNADSRLYDAGQRPVFEDDFDLQSFEPSPKEKHSPDYNFIMSREHSSGIYHYHPWTGLPCVCPWGESKHRGKTSSSQYVRQIKNQKQKAFRTPEGERFLEALDNLIERFPDAEAMAPWMASRYKKGDMVLSPEGEIHHHMGWQGNGVAEQLEQLKQGQWDRPRLGYRVADLAKKLAYDKWDQLPWHERYDSLGRSRMDRSGEIRISPKQLSELTMQGYHPILSQMRQYLAPTAGVLTGWSHWFNARQHPTRRGIDIMQHPPGSVSNMAREHMQALEEARKKEYWLRDYADPSLGDWEKPDVRHVFGPEAGPYKGWNVVRLNPRQAEGDSEALGHCIGSDDQPYKYNIDIGNINAYSLRDAEGYPHVSWHVNPSGNGIGHMQGQGEVPEKYRDLITMFNQSHGLSDEEVGEEALEPEEPEYDRYYTLPQAGDVDDYMRQKEDPWSVAQDDPNANIGEDTELEYQAPDWTWIAKDYLGGGGGRDSDRFFGYLHQNGDSGEFASSLEDNFDPDDADERQLVQYWNSEGARNSDDWVDVPARPVNEVDQYNERVDEGEEPEVEDWGALAHDYLQYPTHYGDREYDRFHDNITQQYEHSPYDMQEALRHVVDWSDPNHSKAMEYWNQHWREQDPNYVVPQPANPPYEEDPNMPVEQSDQSINEPGFGPVQSKWGWERVSDYQGWTNWETWNTALMMDNEYETYTEARELIQQGATPQQLEQWVLQAVLGPHNQAMIKDAQEWNAIDPDERRRMTDERDREQFGDAAVDLGRGLMEPFGGFSDPGEDDSAEIIDPNEVNWYEIYTHIYQELQGNREWATEKGEEFPELPEQHPNPMDQPGDFTLPEGWTSNLKTSDGYMMDPIAVPGKEEMSPPRNEQEAVFQAIGEAAQNGDYERARWLYQFLPENMNPVNQEPMQSGHEILSPAVELQEWLGDLGGEQPEAPSIHHDSPEDTIVAPQTSTSEALPYFPPGNIPKEYKQSATDEEHKDYYDITDHPDLWCSKCGESGMQYYKPKRPGTGAVWYCPHCKHSYHTADIPKTDDLDIDKQIYRGMQDSWKAKDPLSPDVEDPYGLLDDPDEHPVPAGMPPNARPMPAEHQNMDLQCADCGNRRLREEGYAQDPATGNIYCLTCVDARQHLGATAGSPINQADATNDPLGKSPAMIPQRDGDPDYLEVAPCPNCQQLHRPDEPCPTNSVTQFRQQERAWYNRDNNAQHGPGPGPNGLEDHARLSGWRERLEEMTPEAMAVGRSCYFHPDRPAVIADGFAPMCAACAASWNQVNAEQPKVAGSWDPLTCEQCGAPMTEPKMLGNKYMNHCTRCGLWREVPTNFPILQQQRQEEAISPYPSILREVGPERAWISSTWEW